MLFSYLHDPSLPTISNVRTLRNRHSPKFRRNFKEAIRSGYLYILTLQLLLNRRINDIKADNCVNTENEVAKSFFYSFSDKPDNGRILITNWNRACFAKLVPRGLQEGISSLHRGRQQILFPQRFITLTSSYRFDLRVQNVCLLLKEFLLFPCNMQRPKRH